MNNKLLTGVRRLLFVIIARQPGITSAHLCAYSSARGGHLSRINHHLSGLIDEGFIYAAFRNQHGQSHYQITSRKGKRMLKYLQQAGIDSENWI